MFRRRRKDPWRREEFADLPDECFINGCSYGPADVRGPVWTRDGKIYKACTEHWEAIHSILGRQVSADAATETFE